MNIMMVGHSRAGKTAFMAAMYKYLGEDKSGYGIHAEDTNQRMNLKRMADNIVKGIYPNQTDMQSQYKFTFTIEGKDVMPFNWLDYRGGLLTSKNPTNKEQEEFMTALKYADALIVFLDGEKLSDPSSRWNNEYRMLISCIQGAIREQREYVYPICFVITKCDIYGDFSYGLTHFKPLFEQIESAQHVEAMVLRSVVNKDCLVYPFAALSYCIFRGLPFYEKRRLSALEEAKKRYDSHKPESLIGWIFAVIEEIARGTIEVLFDGGWNTELDLANMAEKDIEREYAKLQLLGEVHEDLESKIIDWIKKDILIHF